jgi:hypothetical protein
MFCLLPHYPELNPHQEYLCKRRKKKNWAATESVTYELYNMKKLKEQKSSPAHKRSGDQFVTI